MPALWYHTGPHAGKVRTVDRTTARRDIAAGIAQDMARSASSLKPARRGTYGTRDMVAAESPKNKGGRPRRKPVEDTPDDDAQVVPTPAETPAPAPAPAPDSSAEVGTPPAESTDENPKE